MTEERKNQLPLRVQVPRYHTSTSRTIQYQTSTHRKQPSQKTLGYAYQYSIRTRSIHKETEVTEERKNQLPLRVQVPRYHTSTSRTIQYQTSTYRKQPSQKTLEYAYQYSIRTRSIHKETEVTEERKNQLPLRVQVPRYHTSTSRTIQYQTSTYRKQPSQKTLEYAYQYSIRTRSIHKETEVTEERKNRTSE